jgi:hypothetical protein
MGVPPLILRRNRTARRECKKILTSSSSLLQKSLARKCGACQWETIRVLGRRGRRNVPGSNPQSKASSHRTLINKKKRKKLWWGGTEQVPMAFAKTPGIKFLLPHTHAQDAHHQKNMTTWQERPQNTNTPHTQKGDEPFGALRHQNEQNIPPPTSWESYLGNNTCCTWQSSRGRKDDDKKNVACSQRAVFSRVQDPGDIKITVIQVQQITAVHSPPHIIPDLFPWGIFLVLGLSSSRKCSFSSWYERWWIQNVHELDSDPGVWSTVIKKIKIKSSPSNSTAHTWHRKVINLTILHPWQTLFPGWIMARGKRDN